MTDARTSPRPEAAAGYRVKATQAEGRDAARAPTRRRGAPRARSRGDRRAIAPRSAPCGPRTRCMRGSTRPIPIPGTRCRPTTTVSGKRRSSSCSSIRQGRVATTSSWRSAPRTSPATSACAPPYPNLVSELAWDHVGLATAVCALRDQTGTVGWTAAAELPWGGFRSLPVPAHVALPPESGDSWRFNAYRIKRPGGPQRPKDGALLEAWSPTGTPSFHVPSAFRPLRFA